MQSRKLVSEGRSFEITWEDLFVETVEGEGGAEGEPRQRHFLTHEELEDFVDRQVQRRLDAGFVEAPAVDSVPDDPGKAAELEALVEANLDSVEPFLVYADWLQGRGDARGELIALQHRLAATPTGELLAEEQRLFATHGPALLGPLADCPQIARLAWRLGFVEKACFFVERPQDYDETTLLRSFLAHPACRFLRELVICDRDLRLDSLVEALLHIPAHPTVTRLQLGAPSKRPRVGVGSGLLARFPRLRELRLFAMPLLLEPVEHDALSRLVLNVETTREHVAALAGSTLPALRELSFVHESPAWAEPGTRFLEELAATRFPKLERLAIRFCRRGPRAQAFRPLLAAPLLRTLKALELSAPSDGGLPALLERESHLLSHLSLTVDASWTDEQLGSLRRSGLKVDRAGAWPPPEFMVALPKEEHEPEELEDAYDDGSYGDELDDGEYDVVQRIAEDGPSTDALDRAGTDNALPPLYDETGGKDEK